MKINLRFLNQMRKSSMMIQMMIQVTLTDGLDLAVIKVKIVPSMLVEVTALVAGTEPG